MDLQLHRIAKMGGADDSTCDRLGRSRSDYQQELAVRALVLVGRWEGDVPQRWMWKSLWNHSRQMRRSAWTQWRRLPDLERPPVAQYEETDRYDARESLRRVAEAVSDADEPLLARLLDAGGHAGDAYDPEVDGTREAYRQRLCRMRGRLAAALRGGVA